LLLFLIGVLFPFLSFPVARLVCAAASGMSQEEMKSCRVFFNNFDRFGLSLCVGGTADCTPGPIRLTSPLDAHVCVCECRSKSRTINGWELQIALEAMGQNPQEDDIRMIIQQLGAEKTGTLGTEFFDCMWWRPQTCVKRESNTADSNTHDVLSYGPFHSLSPACRFHTVPEGHSDAARH